MRILLIRHGDPDYEHDTLTEKRTQGGRTAGKEGIIACDGKLLSVSPWQGDGYGTALSESDGKRCGSTGVAAGISGTAGSE